jgi:hypothetical protein
VSVLPHDPVVATSAASAIVITGMHRSGTSLITSAFQLAGVNIGDRLMGRHDSNRRGHFEDVEFEEFHERVLRRVGKHHLTVAQADVLAMMPDEVEHAKALIARRRERRLWGWKDPRTCLFLDFWHPLLTNSRYVFVYRHPLEVVLSLLRRHYDVDIVEVVPDPLTALQSWVTHNQAMFDFYQRHQAQCVLGHVHALAGDLPGVLALCARKFRVELQGENASTVYQPAELTQRVIPKETLVEFARLAPLAAMLYRQIDQAADLAQPTFECLDSSNASDGAQDGRETLTQEFELLLTRLEPQAVLAGRRALDALRGHELNASGVRREGLEAHGRVLESRVAELAAQNSELQTEMALLKEHGLELDLRLQEAQHRLQETQHEAQHRLQETQHEAQHRLVEMSLRAVAAEARADERASERVNFQAQNSELQTEMALVKKHGIERELRLDEARQQFMEASTRVAVAEARADERASDRAALQAQNAVLRDRQVQREIEHARLIWSLEEARGSLTAARAETVAERARSSEAATALAGKESQLAAIAQTRAWRAAQKWYAFKRTVRRLLTGANPS